MDYLLSKKIVSDTLSDFITLPNKTYPGLREILIIDEAKQHFILFCIGWNKKKYVHETTFHVEAKENEEIWIHQNNTDVPIEYQLVERGIAKAEIKIGRNFSEHQVALLA